MSYLITMPLSHSWYQFTTKTTPPFDLKTEVPGVIGSGTSYRVPRNAVTAVIALLKGKQITGAYKPLVTDDQWHPGPSYGVHFTPTAWQQAFSERASQWGSIYLRLPPGAGRKEAVFTTLAANGIERAIFLVPPQHIDRWAAQIELRMGIIPYLYTPPVDRKRAWKGAAEWTLSHGGMPHFLIISHAQVERIKEEGLAPYFLGGQHAALVVDQIHLFDDPRIQPRDEHGQPMHTDAKAIALYKLSQYRSHVLRIGVSTQPAPELPYDLIMQLQALQPGMWGKGHLPFAKRYCGAREIQGRINKKETIWQFTGISNQTELLERLREVIYDVPREEILKEAMPLRVSPYVLSVDQQLKQVAAGRAFSKEVLQAREQGGAALLSLQLARAALTAARELVLQIQVRLQRNEKILVLAHHPLVCSQISERIKQTDPSLSLFSTAGMVGGGMDQPRTLAAFEYHDGPCICVTSVEALIQHGLKKKPSTCFIVEIPLSLSLLAKALQRLDGGDSPHTCEVHLIIPATSAADRLMRLAREEIPLIRSFYKGNQGEKLSKQCTDPIPELSDAWLGSLLAPGE